MNIIKKGISLTKKCECGYEFTYNSKVKVIKCPKCKEEYYCYQSIVDKLMKEESEEVIFKTIWRMKNKSKLGSAKRSNFIRDMIACEHIQEIAKKLRKHVLDIDGVEYYEERKEMEKWREELKAELKK